MAETRKWILCVEDNPDDVEIIRELLPRNLYPVTWAKSGAEAMEQLEAIQFDLVLLDHGLPDTNSLAFLEKIQFMRADVPVIVLTGREDDFLNVSTVKKGAAAFLTKDGMTHKLRKTIEYVLAERAGVQLGELDHIESAGLLLRRRMENIHYMLVATMNEGFLLVDFDGIVTFANEATGRIFVCPSEKLLGRRAEELFDFATRSRITEFLGCLESSTSAEARSTNFEGGLVIEAKDHESPAVLCSMRSLGNELNQYEACILVLTDISELVRVRTDLQQRLSELERFQRFFIDRERRIIELKNRILEYERMLGVTSPGLSDETRQEMGRRLRAHGAAQ